MSRYHSYLNSTVSILTSYRGGEPFALALKKYFSVNKKFGSRDRKLIASLCYAYFRAARLFEKDTTKEKILKSFFLCSALPNELLSELRPEWNDYITTGAEEKYSMLNPDGYRDHSSLSALFPWSDELSDGIDEMAYLVSLLVQPNLFLRIRPGMAEKVKGKLIKAGVQFEMINESCLSLPNASHIDRFIQLDEEAVVQDLSSQRVGELIRLAGQGYSDTLRVWDCCAASGGKSILAKDVLGNIDLTVSDIRDSILANLRKRFTTAGITGYRAVKTDLSVSGIKDDTGFNLIICDAPCTGSGTWGRTPEQLHFFDAKKIEEYAALQRKILDNVVTSLKPGGFLLYITCSVFKKENEEIAGYAAEQFHLKYVKTELFKGYDKKADTMFASLLQKSLQPY